MLFDRLTVIRALFPRSKEAARAPVARWAAAAETEPELVADLIRLGGILAKHPVRFVNGEEVSEPLDPLAMARREGRRDLALELLAMAGVTGEEFRKIMEDDAR